MLMPTVDQRILNVVLQVVSEMDKSHPSFLNRSDSLKSLNLDGAVIKDIITRRLAMTAGKRERPNISASNTLLEIAVITQLLPDAG